MPDDITLFPVTGFEVGTIPEYEIVFIRLPFLSHPFQKLAEADPGRRYALQPAQARELISAIERALHALESGGRQSRGLRIFFAGLSNPPPSHSPTRKLRLGSRNQ